MVEQNLTVNFKARYYRLGHIDANTRHVWFVIHGYGQLARFFLKKFNVLHQPDVCIIAPEGLSRFYLEDITTRNQTGNQKVGATWMTRENRLMDIENYITYLNGVYQAEITPAFSGQVHLLGFSQGAATVVRWALHEQIRFDRLILWAGIFPPDMDFDKATEIFKKKQVIEVYGQADPFLQDDRIREMTQTNQRLGITPTVVSFDGGHEIKPDVLQKLA